MPAMTRALLPAALALLLATACSEETPAPEAAAPVVAEAAPAPPAPQPVVPAPVAPAGVPQAAKVDACAMVPGDLAGRALNGRPAGVDAAWESQQADSVAGACVMHGAAGQPGLRVEVFTPASWTRSDIALDQYWAQQTTDGSVRAVTAKVGAPAFWVSRPMPQRRALLVQGRDGSVYEFSSVEADGTPLRSADVERIAARMVR